LVEALKAGKRLDILYINYGAYILDKPNYL
jgi:hypothetical protein